TFYGPGTEIVLAQGTANQETVDVQSAAPSATMVGSYDLVLTTFLSKTHVAGETITATQFGVDLNGDGVINTTDRRAADGTLLSEKELFPNGGLVAPQVVFRNLTLDVGQFLTKVISPVLGFVNKYVGPLRPVLDFLNAEVPGLSQIAQLAGSDKITNLQLAI